MIERAKLVIVEINRHIPYVLGKDNGVHTSEADYIIEGDDQPCAELPNPEPSEIDRTVARRIAAEVEDGSCLQIGIGGMPNAVCALLMDSGVKDLGIHTEMMTDGLVLLYRSGRVTGARKTLDRGKVIYTFALGSLALYATANRNPDWYCHQVDYTNSPHKSFMCLSSTYEKKGERRSRIVFTLTP